MAAKSKSVYVCSSCGYETSKWFGQCPSCQEWNTMEEELRVVESGKAKKPVYGGLQSNRSAVRSLNDIAVTDEHRFNTGLKELNRVLGGGIVKGSLILLSGDPGIGKSTLLLQICEHLGKSMKILYVSGEESAHQLKLRAARLGVSTENLFLLCETDAQYICEAIAAEKPDLVMVDSIQTMNITELSSSCGSVTQVRETTNLFMRTAKSLNIPTIIVGHVNKDGNIAGPKVLEHIVDAVLYFEGDRNLSYRILRAVKNRYGSTNEIGVFEMLDDGLHEVENPSMMLLSGRPKNVSGVCVACIMEGSRPILAEVQSLVTPTGFGTPRRMATGVDYGRMSMLLAVLEKRAGYFLGNMDCYVNIIGGLKIDEPACDLSVALAVVSGLKDVPVPADVLVFGEIGLGGEIRAVSACEQRIREAEKLGFRKCVVPKYNLMKIQSKLKVNIEVIGVSNVRQAFEAVL